MTGKFRADKDLEPNLEQRFSGMQLDAEGSENEQARQLQKQVKERGGSMSMTEARKSVRGAEK